MSVIPVLFKITSFIYLLARSIFVGSVIEFFFCRICRRATYHCIKEEKPNKLRHTHHAHTNTHTLTFCTRKKNMILLKLVISRFFQHQQSSHVLSLNSISCHGSAINILGLFSLLRIFSELLLAYRN